ncbi:hypothetical protein BZG36_04421 [Bifiguratus adelaidae]|uniref:Uncharacterized protein n=1 Tax=Bifiguratus adelaidae TaxID=1938954 RepID=A0A261XWS5_9FUNG|nr:hypothetical protein BZG36_04421 [Bifiguratus adelaidae]
MPNVKRTVKRISKILKHGHKDECDSTVPSEKSGLFQQNSQSITISDSPGSALQPSKKDEEFEKEGLESHDIDGNLALNTPEFNSTAAESSRVLLQNNSNLPPSSLKSTPAIVNLLMDPHIDNQDYTPPPSTLNSLAPPTRTFEPSIGSRGKSRSLNSDVWSTVSSVATGHGVEPMADHSSETPYKSNSELLAQPTSASDVNMKRASASLKSEPGSSLSEETIDSTSVGVRIRAMKDKSAHGLNNDTRTLERNSGPPKTDIDIPSDTVGTHDKVQPTGVSDINQNEGMMFSDAPETAAPRNNLKGDASNHSPSERTPTKRSSTHSSGKSATIGRFGEHLHNSPPVLETSAQDAPIDSANTLQRHVDTTQNNADNTTIKDGAATSSLFFGAQNDGEVAPAKASSSPLSILACSSPEGTTTSDTANRHISILSAKKPDQLHFPQSPVQIQESKRVEDLSGAFGPIPNVKDPIQSIRPIIHTSPASSGHSSPLSTPARGGSRTSSPKSENPTEPKPSLDDDKIPIWPRGNDESPLYPTAFNLARGERWPSNLAQRILARIPRGDEADEETDLNADPKDKIINNLATQIFEKQREMESLHLRIVQQETLRRGNTKDETIQTFEPSDLVPTTDAQAAQSEESTGDENDSDNDNPSRTYPLPAQRQVVSALEAGKSTDMARADYEDIIRSQAERISMLELQLMSIEEKLDAQPSDSSLIQQAATEHFTDASNARI